MRQKRRLSSQGGKRSCRVMIHSIGFFIQAINFSDLVEYRLFERSLDVVKDMEDEMFLGPPRMEAGSKIEYPIGRDQRMEHLRYKLDSRWAFGVVWREQQTKLEDAISVVSLMDKEYGVPDKKRLFGWDYIDTKRTVRPVTQRRVFKGDCCTCNGGYRI